MPAHLEISRTGKGQFSFQSQRRQCQKYSNYCTIALISHPSKVMLKILQAKLQQYVNCELPDVQVGFRKGRRTRDQVVNIHWIIEKAREFEKKYLLIYNYPLCVTNIQDVKAGFRKGRGHRDQIANIRWIIKKAREFQKNIYFCFIDYTKAFDCVDHNKLWNILKEMGIPDHLTCLLRNLHAGQEATVRTGRGKMDWFQIGKGVRQGCILSP